jgi:hypothetical protein
MNAHCGLDGKESLQFLFAMYEVLHTVAIESFTEQFVCPNLPGLGAAMLGLANSDVERTGGSHRIQK